MAAPSGRIQSSPTKNLLSRIKHHLQLGDAEKLFTEESFVLDLIKSMYEDSVNVHVRTELILIFEEHGCHSIHSNSVEQVVSSLLDLLNQNVNLEGRQNLCIQIVITLTTITINRQLVETPVGSGVITGLWNIIKNINRMTSRRVRGACCQAMIQIEDFYPGLLWRFKDDLLCLVKTEKSHVCQDYVHLLSKILQATSRQDELKTTEEDKQKVPVVRSVSVPEGQGQEMLRDISYVMEMVPLLTSSTLWSVIRSLAAILRTSTDISPSIFKPLMLHHMATMDPMVFHLVLHLQKEFEGVVFTTAEENQLLLRLMTGVNHPSLSPAHRLLFIQWLKGYKTIEQRRFIIPDYISQDHQDKFYPTDFDSLDLLVGKLQLLTASKNPDQNDDFIKDLINKCAYLQQLVEVTGRQKPTLALYKSLYIFYKQHPAPLLIDYIKRVTEKVLSKYPALIPLVLNFLQCLRETSNNSGVYMEILSTLHESVLLTTYEEVLNQYNYYLLVLQVAAKQTDFNQQTTVKYLQGLTACALYNGVCDWYLGNAVLTVCRNILAYQDTDTVFTDLGELLFEMSRVCGDTDIQDKSRFYYALLTNASDEKIHVVLSESVGEGKFTSQSFTSLLPGSMNEKQKATITDLSQPILEMKREKISPLFTWDDQHHRLSSVDKIAEYMELTRTLTIHLQVQYSMAMVNETDFDHIYAVSVKLENDGNFQAIKESHVAEMNKTEWKEFSFKLEPLEPKPTTFSISVLLTADGQTYSSALHPSHLLFSHLLTPFPWQQLNVEPQLQYQLWTNLWCHLTGETKDPKKGIESHKISTCSYTKLHQLWQEYYINHTPSDNSSAYIMMVPPRYHILFRVKPRKEDLVVSMATDHWPLLPLINNYINNLNSDD